ncbi:hypothetical protein [Neobacillus bataviensis]|uniref:hypothetical protein n=1 Tax=Neobacillus bataviensis TaxID=220685 RepID=UPI001CBC98C2|nr:hypothetical protein [Neobacillus bataviensis]
MQNEPQYVWYASYGSNINAERFLCYIKGGRPVGSAKVEIGCKDPSLPIDETTFTINLPLYFAKEAGKWESQGVAFLGLNQNTEYKTLSKKYLITTDQFLDVVKQENNGVEFNLDLNEVKTAGSKIFRRQSWYGNVMYLGEDNGYPIFTFTAPWDIKDVEWKKPSRPYLLTIVNGLKKDFSEEEIYNYFKNKPGIKENYADEELAAIIFHK